MKALVTHVTPLAAALALLVCAAPPAAAQRRAPRDRGGTSLLLEVKTDASQAARDVERTAAVLRKRCARLRVFCHIQTRPGGAPNRLALRFSAASDAGRVKGVLLAKGFELRAVVTPPHPAPPRTYPTRAEALDAAGPRDEVFPLEGHGEEAYVVTELKPILTGDDVRSPLAVRAQPAELDSGREYEVDCLLRPRGSAGLKAWTRANLNRYVAVVFNGRAHSVPYVRAPVWLNVVIAGGFDRRQAEDVAAVLAGGNLPAPVEVLEEGTYNP